MLRKLFVRTFWTVYDHLGLLLLASLGWTALSWPWWGGVLLLARALRPPLSELTLLALIPVTALNPASLGLAALARELVRTGEATAGLFWTGLRRHLFRSLWLMAFGALVALILGSSWAVYSAERLPLVGRWGNRIAAGLTVWVVLFALLAGSYWSPLAADLSGRRIGLKTVLYRSALLTLDNPGFTLGVALLCWASWAFWAATGLGLFVLAAGWSAVLQRHARDLLGEKYEVVETLRQEGRPISRAAVRAALQERWRQEPQRSWRELIRPWDARS